MTFDSTVVGQPYTRIQRVVIDYPAPATAHVTVQHQQHVPLVDGSHQPLGGVGEVSFKLLPNNMGDAVALHMPGADTDLELQTTVGDLMVGIYSVIRGKF
jgi:hypothetical protein